MKCEVTLHKQEDNHSWLYWKDAGETKSWDSTQHVFRRPAFQADIPHKIGEKDTECELGWRTFQTEEKNFSSKISVAWNDWSWPARKGDCAGKRKDQKQSAVCEPEEGTSVVYLVSANNQSTQSLVFSQWLMANWIRWFLSPIILYHFTNQNNICNWQDRCLVLWIGKCNSKK